MGIQLNIPDKMLPFWTERKSFKVAKGGRGGGKSWSIGRMLVIKAYTETHLILCAREYQNSISDSVHRLLKDQIAELGLTPWFQITETSIRCTLTGSEFIFKGIRRNINEIKSTEGITITWVEEAQAVSENSWVVLIPTVLRRPGAEIWVSYNPGEDTDPTHVRFAKQPPPDSLLVTINWNDNPWFPPALEGQRAFMQATDPDAYDWVWGGQTRHMSEATIFRGRFRVEPFETPDPAPRFMYGADWGFSQDPTALVRCWERPIAPATRKTPAVRHLMIDHEAFGIQVETDDIAALFAGGKAQHDERSWPGIPGARDWPIKADSARPETISFVRRAGFNIRPAKKWAGSVEDGIAYLKTYAVIYIHPRCVNMAQEARLYSYAVDPRTNDILPTIVDKHNHGWDAVRYAHDGLITAGGAYGSWQRLAQGKK